MKRGKSLLLVLMVFLAGGACASTSELVKPFTVEKDIYDLNLPMVHFTMDSSITGRGYQIDVSHPANCAELKNLPVIYMTDGGWRRMDHKYIHYLTAKEMIPPMLVVGVGYLDGEDANTVRTFDLYSGDTFLRALKEEVIPLVEKNYPVDPAQRYLFGASMGGRFAAYACLQDALDGDTTFCGYIGSSPYLAGSRVQEMAEELAARKPATDKSLFLAYGALEGTYDYHVPNDMLYRTLDQGAPAGLDFHRYVYPGSDHFTNTRLTLIDGLRLLLGTEEARGVGAVDLGYSTLTYDFSSSSQFYDWKTDYLEQISYSTDPAYSIDGRPGSVQITADFTKYGILTFSTSSVYFEGFADREVQFNIHVPADLAKLGYTLRFMIHSTIAFPWFTDYSDEEFKLNKSGWNTFKYKWRDQYISGNLDCIRGFGIVIGKNGSAREWRGTLYIDNVKW